MIGLLSPYKIYFIIGAVLLYSFGIWKVASGYTSSKYLSAQVKQAEAILVMKQHDQELADQLGKKLEDQIATIKINNTTIYRNTQHELVTHKFYTECANTPDVVRNIEAAIDNKTKSSHK